MLKKHDRLSAKELKSFFSQKTRSYHGTVLMMRVHKRQDKLARWAFVVSNTIKKNAVARNSVRRRMGSIAEKLQKHIVGGWDIVFFIKLVKKQSPSSQVLQDDMIKVLTLCGALSE